MHKLIIAAFLVFSGVTAPAFAQTSHQEATSKRKINVSGKSEMEVVPNQLFFNITLREYFEDEKNQKNKVLISNLEKQLIKSIEAAGYSQKDLSITQVGGYQSADEKKKKPASFLENKRYELIVSSPQKLDLILSKIDDRAIQYANIAKVDHSDKEELEKQVKIQALKNAKIKAEYLVTALNGKLGDVLEINEVDGEIQYPQAMLARANFRSLAEGAQQDVTESDIAYQKIKISHVVQASFEIK
ncbi:SIMPL domain-containing protein [Dyadobacter tibetensis]|uniref:SIMPL domain-containing protein n=1 Tax=Dyadobacter tibetensis TaxID=1211851 RepID=UPI0004713A05|nr:SIMPL domain-containing protein [Dyadobacter tibetensis]